jgi:hypothetical protein
MDIPRAWYSLRQTSEAYAWSNEDTQNMHNNFQQKAVQTTAVLSTGTEEQSFLSYTSK